MGVIKRQGIKHSVVRYIGIIMGAINVMFLLPLFLGDEKLGLLNFIVQVAFMTQAFSMLGIGSVLIKFFPEFKDNNKQHNGLFTFSIIWTFIGFFIFLVIIWGLQSWVVSYYQQKPKEYLQYLPFIIPIVFFLSFFTLLKLYVYNFQRIVVPAIFDQLYKVIVPILAGLFYFKIFPFEYIMYGLIAYFAAIFLGMIFYIFRLKQWQWSFDFSFFKTPLLKRIFSYAGFSVLSSLGSTLALRIDTVMVASMIDLSNTGIYTVALFIATVIKVPGESIRSVASSIISQNITANNMLAVEELYKKSSTILWTVGLFLLLNIWINVDSIFEIMPRGETFGKGKYVILILGLGILFDLLTSVNSEIINYSPYYRYNFFFLLLLGALNIGANILFIPQFGILGAALATASSLVLFNLMKLFFIYSKYRMSPFSKETMLVFMIALSIFGFIEFFSFTMNPFLSIFFKSSIASVLFLSSILYFRISEDINAFLLEIWNKVK